MANRIFCIRPVFGIGPAGRMGLLMLMLANVTVGTTQAAFLPIFGGPTISNGYGNPTLPSPSDSSIVGGNVAGSSVGVGAIEKFVARNNKGLRAVRWDTLGNTAIELEILGTSSSGSSASQAYFVNHVGMTVGYANKYVTGTSMGNRAVRWDASGAVTELSNLGTNSSGITDSRAYALNDTGITVGYAHKYVGGVDKGARAIRWDALGVAFELGHLGTNSSGVTHEEAYAINSSGIAVGYGLAYFANNTIGTRAVRWGRSGDAIELGDINNSLGGRTDAAAYAINDAGTAVGAAAKYINGDGSRAVRWDASGTAATELGNLGTDLHGYTTSYSTSINNAGTAVGFARRYDDGGGDHGNRAARWDSSGTAATELGNLGTTNLDVTDTGAYAINDAGITVGYADKYENFFNYKGRRAVMWGPDGVAIDLNTLIDPASGWTLTNAYAISSDNWITGIGRFYPDGPDDWDASYDRLFLMQVPEPASLPLLIFGAGLTLRRRRYANANSCIAH